MVELFTREELVIFYHKVILKICKELNDFDHIDVKKQTAPENWFQSYFRQFYHYLDSKIIVFGRKSWFGLGLKTHAFLIPDLADRYEISISLTGCD